VFSILKTSFLTFLSQSQDTFGYIWVMFGAFCWRQGIISTMECGDVLGVKIMMIMRQAAKLLSVPWGIVGEGNSWTPVATHLMSMLVKDGERTSE